MRPLALLFLAGAAFAQSDTSDLIFRARHAQIVAGDVEKAIDLFTRVLTHDRSLSPEQEALVHLRLALCHAELAAPKDALAHLHERIFERDGVPDGIQLRASRLRELLRRRLPKPAAGPVTPREDPAAARAKRVQDHVRRARGFLQLGNDWMAFYYAQSARELDPDDPQVRALSAELETRLSGVMGFVRDPLEFVRRWTAAATRATAKEAEGLILEGRRHAARGEFNLAEARFGEAVSVIDACEFAHESDELTAMRQGVREHWRALRRKHLGEEHADPVLPEVPRRTTFVADFLNQMQRMLDAVSSTDHEYRILPVAARGKDSGKRWRVKPRRFALFEHLESRWSEARFAGLYLAQRVHPESWREPGNYLESAGGMLIARNHPRTLDALREALRDLESPRVPTLRTRFLLVSLEPERLARFVDQFGAFSRSDASREGSLHYREVRRAQATLLDLCSFLRDLGADIRLDRDTFGVELRNGAAQTLFAGVPVDRSAPPEPGAPVLATHYGLLLDLFPLRERSGRTALALRARSRSPTTLPTLGPEGATSAFLTQEGELFCELAPGSTLAVTGLVDPFSPPARSRLLLLLFENPAGEGAATAGPATSTGADVSLQRLLRGVRDHPGPRGDETRGLVRREPVEVLLERARFLESLMRERLSTEELTIDAEQAAAFVPPALRQHTLDVVTDLERETERSYVVRVQVRVVRTRAFERLLERDRPDLLPFGEAFVVRCGSPEGEGLLRGLLRTGTQDLFGSETSWPALTVLGLQARHALCARTRTSPTYAGPEDLTTSETRTVTEGLRVTVRPFRAGERLRAWIDVESAGILREVEEIALSRGVPSYHTTVSGTRAAGMVDFGSFSAPDPVLVCRIPHPTASTPESLTEIAVALDVRPLP